MKLSFLSMISFMFLINTATLHAEEPKFCTEKLVNDL